MPFISSSTDVPPIHDRISTGTVDGLGMVLTSPARAVAAGTPDGQARITTELPPRHPALWWWFAGVLVCQVLDGVSGAQLMQTRGVEAELNPLARSVFAEAGWTGLLLFKAGVLGATLPLLSWVARCGRVQTARVCLLLAAGLGLLGWWSNQL
ncbi:MAG TPA: hypothetical protein VGW38_15460 [Chloroflexota bacterium]|nr:hypothetical protein [Chloroflexota bacterium]